MKRGRYLLLTAVIITSLIAGAWSLRSSLTENFVVGRAIDEYHGEPVYYNGLVTNVSGRRLADDGYNLGLKYQCVEFVKRYYYNKLDHKMPNSYGHAKDFFNPAVSDGHKNVERNLIQYTNLSSTKPMADDLLVFRSSIFNKYGHVAIISQVREDEIEIVQQNAGPFSDTRENFPLLKINNKWRIDHPRILGWLRK